MLEKLLTDSWTFFKNHVVALSMIILPIAAPVDIFTALYLHFLASDKHGFAEIMIPAILGIITYPIYTVGVIIYIASILADEKLDTKTLWRLGGKYWLPFTVISMMAGLIMMFGFILLIVPGLVFAARFAFSEFDLLLNQSKPVDAMRNSWHTTRGYVGVMLGGYLVITLALYVPYFLISAIFDKGSISFWMLDTMSTVVYSVLGAMYTIFAFRVYEFAKSQRIELLNQNAS